MARTLRTPAGECRPVAQVSNQVSNLLCRRLSAFAARHSAASARRRPVGRPLEFSSACGLEIRDTADWEVCATSPLRPAERFDRQRFSPIEQFAGKTFYDLGLFSGQIVTFARVARQVIQLRVTAILH